MTELIHGSRFLDLVPDEFDVESEYIPRHLRAVPLSPELQQALDAAFAPEPLPSGPDAPQTLPVPEPLPGPTAGDAAVLAREAQPAEDAELADRVGLVVPETHAYPPVLPASIFLPRPSRPAVIEPAASTVAPPEPVVPDRPVVAVVAFPDPGSYAARKASGAAPAGPAPSLASRLFRGKVDASRLAVPSM